MSVAYKPVGWTRSKMLYDAVLIAAILSYLLLYFRFGANPPRLTQPPDAPTVAMRAFGTCAFLLLTAILCIGPAARLNRFFLPVLYNRRHFGVLTSVVATMHALAVLNWYYAFSKIPLLAALFGADTSFGQLSGFPFALFGIFALLVLWLMAATSHDFWLNFLTPPVWKALHMLVYAAYAAMVAHVALGAMQDAASPVLAIMVCASVALVTALHLLAASRVRAADRAAARLAADGWVLVPSPAAIDDGRGVVLPLPRGGTAAVFREGNRLTAIANACAHQNGPLGEGRIIDGCITCPWHGYQYRPEDGCSPPPFTERVATYALRFEAGEVWLNPAPNPLGTVTPPLEVAL
jgi:nitrite reductase/ring-hydroxylating ferredoxin subunit/DMSO/TMAO reductase YedYZ heme-binding membrane subunit